MINTEKIFNRLMEDVIMNNNASEQTNYETWAAIYTLMAKLERCNIETNINESKENRRKKNAKKKENNINQNGRDPVQ